MPCLWHSRNLAQAASRLLCVLQEQQLRCLTPRGPSSSIVELVAVSQATTGEKARSWLHTNLDKLDKKIEKHNQPSSTYMQPQNSYQGPPQGGYQGPPQGGYQGPPQGGYQGNQVLLA